MPPLNQEVFAWLGARGAAPAGAPFWKYNVIDMAGKLEIEAGVPVAAAVAGDDRVVAGVLPAGRYATLTHVGHPSELMAATKALLDWAAEQGLTWDVTPGAGGDLWACRLENYLTDPSQEPDMSKWVTQLAFKLAGERQQPLLRTTNPARVICAGQLLVRAFTAWVVAAHNGPARSLWRPSLNPRPPTPSISIMGCEYRLQFICSRGVNSRRAQFTRARTVC